MGYFIEKFFLNGEILLCTLAVFALLLNRTKRLQEHTDFIDSIPERNLGLWIALAAGLGLYLELMMVRMHSSYFHLFAYFKNVSLLSCFLGLGIGYAQSQTLLLSTAMVLPLLAMQTVLLQFCRFHPIAFTLQNPVPEQLILGISHLDWGHGFTKTLATTYAFLIFFFVFNTLTFIPMGHLASRLMSRKPGLSAYAWNLVGSLAGVILFAVISFFWAPPAVWLVLAAVGLGLFFYKNISNLVAICTIILLVSLYLAEPFRPYSKDVYSPYQVLTLYESPHEYPSLSTNNVYYQRILNLSDKFTAQHTTFKKWADYYGLPYVFKPSPDDVLIVGSGTGNDVAAGIRHGAKHIDAVEIDPAIMAIGKVLHPERPYSSPRVNAVVDDARAYLRKTDKRYDLIVYGLLDSHALLTSKSGIRLDSYVYTVEGLREARQKLKDGGMICLTFCIMRPELGRKIFLMLQDAFDGKKPKVFRADYDGGNTFVAGEHLNSQVSLPPGIRDITATYDTNALHADASTDDWPFFYMPVKKYPSSYFAMLFILLLISFWLIQSRVHGISAGFSPVCFFLGAGFMLVETKSITELALIYGSTWMVTSIVVILILCMALGANLLAMRGIVFSPRLSYALLLASILAGYLQTFNHHGIWAQFMPIILTLPLFFSGYIFSSEIKRTGSVSMALASNLLGAMLGGFLEYNSMYFGFRFLYLVALLMYVAAFLSAGAAYVFKPSQKSV